MKKNHIGEIKRINYLSNELEALYHQSSLKFGITDSVSIVLYTIYDSGNECLLTDIFSRRLGFIRVGNFNIITK